MKGFDFLVRMRNGSTLRKSKMDSSQWFDIYGDPMVIHFSPAERLSVHVCKPQVVSVCVEWRGSPYEFGERSAKGQPFRIFLHNNARSMGNHVEPRFGESAHVFAKTVGLILMEDKQVYTVRFHKDGKTIPNMRMFNYVVDMAAK